MCSCGCTIDGLGVACPCDCELAVVGGSCSVTSGTSVECTHTHTGGPPDHHEARSLQSKADIKVHMWLLLVLLLRVSAELRTSQYTDYSRSCDELK